MANVLRRDRRSAQGQRRGSKDSIDRRDLKRKITAALAGGLVLGVGTVTTLAAWTDDEQAKATFVSGIFKLESRVGAGAFEVNSGSATTLPFNAEGMSPGSMHYASFDVKTTSISTTGGMAKLLPGVVDADPAGMAAYLRLRVAVIGSAEICNSAAVDSVTQSAISAVPVPLADQPLLKNGGNMLRYCFEVQMVENAPSALQGQSATVKWTVNGTSES